MAFKISTRARYALRMMMEIAREGQESYVDLNTISECTKVSKKYLEQLATAMKTAGLIRGLAGPKGGYTLAIPATQIKIGQIVEAAIGPIAVVDCVLIPATCPTSPTCEAHLIWQLVNHKIKEALNEYTLGDLIDQKSMEALFKQVNGLHAAS